jgi:hypothetical protein
MLGLMVLGGMALVIAITATCIIPHGIIKWAKDGCKKDEEPVSAIITSALAWSVFYVLHMMLVAG